MKTRWINVYKCTVTRKGDLVISFGEISLTGIKLNHNYVKALWDAMCKAKDAANEEELADKKQA